MGWTRWRSFPEGPVDVDRVGILDAPTPTLEAIGHSFPGGPLEKADGGHRIRPTDDFNPRAELAMTTDIAADLPLVFTTSAASKVAHLISEEGNPSLMLRVYIQGGGCSGFQYGFTFDEEVQDGDTEVVTDGVTLLVDPMSLQYLMGSEIDYTEGLQGAQFVIRNPNATTTCGCGSSFST